MTVGERIKAVREERGLTQTELGAKIGVSGVAIMRYEKGQRQLNLSQLIRIAAALGVNWNSLVTEEERTRIVMNRNSEESNDSSIVVGGKIIAPNGFKSKYGVYAGRGIEAGGPVEIAHMMQGEQARANKAMEEMTEEGRKRVADYAEDILPRYRRKEAPPEVSPSTDTTPPPDASETHPEGE